MGSRKAPGFFFYSSDFLADTFWWPADAVGVLIRLMAFQAESGGVVPEDRNKLAEITGITYVRFDTLWIDYLEAKFEPCEGGMRNRRLHREFERVAKLKQARSKAGSKGSATRWQNGDKKGSKESDKEQGVATDLPMAKPLPPLPVPEPLPKPEPTPKKKHTSVHFDRFWKGYPKKRAKPDALKAWKSGDHDKHADMLIADVEKRCAEDWQWIKDKGQYVPNGATYLRGERWEDELEKPPTGKSDLEPGGGKPMTPYLDDSALAGELE